MPMDDNARETAEAVAQKVGRAINAWRADDGW